MSRYVVNFEQDITVEQAERIRHAWQEWLKQPERLLVLPKGATLVDMDAPPQMVVDYPRLPYDWRQVIGAFVGGVLGFVAAALLYGVIV